MFQNFHRTSNPARQEFNPFTPTGGYKRTALIAQGVSGIMFTFDREIRVAHKNSKLLKNQAVSDVTI
jgi:hypothetical protein